MEDQREPLTNDNLFVLATATHTTPKCLHIYNHSPSHNYIIKRGFKYIQCANIMSLKQSERTKTDRLISKTLIRAKYLKNIERLQNNIYSKDYFKILKSHNHSVKVDRVFHFNHWKNIWMIKHLSKKFKQLNKLVIKPDIQSHLLLKFFYKLKDLGFHLQTNNRSSDQDFMIKTFEKTVKRLIHLKTIRILVKEEFEDLKIATRVLNLTKNVPNLIDIQISYSSASFGRHESLEFFNFGDIDWSLISTLRFIPHPFLLSNILNRYYCLSNLRDLAFQVSTFTDSRYNTFEYSSLQYLEHFGRLYNLSILFELDERHQILMLQHLRLPKSLNKLTLELKRFDFKVLFNDHQHNLKKFFENFTSIHLHELHLDISIENSYAATYAKFLKPLVIAQPQLKVLRIKFLFANAAQKFAEKIFLSTFKIFNMLNYLPMLQKYEGCFDVIDFTEGEKIILNHSCLSEVSLVFQDIVWQEAPIRGLLEEILGCLRDCKTLRNLQIFCRANKILDNLCKTLRLLQSFPLLSKTDLDWNVDTIEVEYITNYFKQVKRPLSLFFGLRKVIFTRDQIDALRKAMNQNKMLYDVRIAGFCGDIVKEYKIDLNGQNENAFEIASAIYEMFEEKRRSINN